ncbi:nischarin-like [Mustela nigripes]|uniref:nischarin-like n=1 Tax=Mustela nigripes TaxID=77151 RepID=UPI0028151B74|nr:nischarin-like [Mustela nigripes]
MAPCWDLVACQDVKPVTEVGSAPAPMLQKPADSAGKVSSAPEGPPGPIQRPALKRRLAHVLKDTTVPGVQPCPSPVHLAPSAYTPSSAQRLPAPRALLATTAAQQVSPALLGPAAQASSAAMGPSCPTAP